MHINGRNLCIGCMQPLDQNGGCSSCGMNQEDYRSSPRCLKPGTELNRRYVTGKVIGEGSFGITYIAWDKVMDIAVAIKEYFPSDMVSRDVICGGDDRVYQYENNKKEDYDKYLDKFVNEAKVLSQFNEIEGIVSVRDFFYGNNTAYIVMQYIDGISAKEYIKKEGRIPAHQVLQRVRPVLQALEQVHAMGIIHRDISPDNLMIKKDGSFVLIDFGAARMRNIDHTKTMTVVFKRGFSPEEQYRLRGRWGPYTDVYSICATMYYMMTGIAPLDSVIRALRDEMTPLISMKDIDITDEQKRAITKGMAVSVDDRWKNIKDLEEALYQAGEMPGEIPPYILHGAGVVKAVVAVMALVLLSGGILAWRQSRPDTEIVYEANSQSVSRMAISVTTSPQTILYMEELSGLTKKEARRHIDKMGGDIGIVWQQKYSDSVKKGYILSQTPAEGTSYVQGEPLTVTLTVSKGPRLVKVPSVIGLTLAKAKAKLKNRDLKYKIQKVESSKKEGVVTKQSVDSGKKVKKGKTVTLYVSKGVQAVATVTPTAKPTSTPQPSKEDDIGDEFAGIIG